MAPPFKDPRDAAVDEALREAGRQYREGTDAVVMVPLSELVERLNDPAEAARIDALADEIGA